MFKRIYFYFDENGKPLKEKDARILTVKDCNCTDFEIAHSRDEVKIYRRGLVNRLKDRFNEDGSPPTCMFIIHSPTLYISGDRIVINGFEEHNLSVAGLLMEPYSDKKRPLADMCRDRPYYYGFEGYGRFIPKSPYPQSIILCG